MFQRNQILLGIGVLVLLIVVGVITFTAGRNAGLTEQTNIRNEFFQQRAGIQGGAPGTGGSFANAPSAPGAAVGDAAQAARNLQGRQVATGVVKSVQGNVVQVTQRDGSTTSVTLDDKISVTKTITGTVADIQPGWTIAVFEQTGNNGTTRRVLLTQEQGLGQGQRSGEGQGQTQGSKPGQ